MSDTVCLKVAGKDADDNEAKAGDSLKPTINGYLCICSSTANRPLRFPNVEGGN